MQDYLKSYWYYLKRKRKKTKNNTYTKSGKDLKKSDASEIIQANRSDCRVLPGGFYVPLSLLENSTRWTRVVKCDL